MKAGADDELFIDWSIRASFKEQEMLFMDCKSSRDDGDHRMTE